MGNSQVHMHLPKYIFLDPWPSWYLMCNIYRSITFGWASWVPLLHAVPSSICSVGLLRIISRKNYIFLYLPKDKVVFAKNKEQMLRRTHKK